MLGGLRRAARCAYESATWAGNLRQAVDAYAAQHPGLPGRRQQQSVALHLIALCAWYERGHSSEQLQRSTAQLADMRRDWPWLTPPTAYALSIAHVLAAPAPAAAAEAIRAWAEAVWLAWSAHHVLIRRWANELG